MQFRPHPYMMLNNSISVVWMDTIDMTRSINPEDHDPGHTLQCLRTALIVRWQGNYSFDLIWDGLLGNYWTAQQIVGHTRIVMHISLHESWCSMNLSYFHITPRVYTHMPFIRILSIIPTMDTTESEICPGFHQVLENMKQQLLCVMQLYSILYSKLCGLWPI